MKEVADLRPGLRDETGVQAVIWAQKEWFG